jgi:hypothetical protein
MTAAGILSNPSSGTSQAEVPQFLPFESVEREEGELSEIPPDLDDLIRRSTVPRVLDVREWSLKKLA